MPPVLGVALCAPFVALTIGVIYGAVSGYIGGKADAVMMRLVDIIYALPFTIFVILLMAFFGRNIILLFVANRRGGMVTMRRIVRGQIMALKKMEFIEAARSLGFSNRRIIFPAMIPTSSARSSSTHASPFRPSCCSRPSSASSASACSRR